MYRPCSGDLKLPATWADVRSSVFAGGHAVLETFAASPLLDALRVEGDRLAAVLVDGQEGTVVARDDNGAVLSMHHLDRHSDLLFDLIRLPVLVKGAEAILESRCVPFLTEYFAKPGHSPQRTPAHQDQIFYRDHFGDELAVTFWIPLDAVGAGDGALEYASPQPPGTTLLRHRESAVQNFGAELVTMDGFMFRPAPVPCGGALVHHSFAVHRSGPVDRPTRRAAFALNYRRSPYRQRMEPWTP
jgi:ectoine hydroxylase-related dioxygenase (phytanoyl-CoA dioxygenase family)